MAPGKWGLASESSWVCLRGAEHPPLELNLVIFTELVPSVFSLRFSWKISLFASCRSCWACSAKLDLSPPGKIPELPNVRISVWSPSNTTHRSEVQLWLNLVGFLPCFHLLRTLLRRTAVRGAVRKGQCWISSKWGGRAPAWLHHQAALVPSWHSPGKLLNSCTQELCASEAQTPISLGDKKAFHGTHQSDSQGAVLLKIQMLIIKL